MARLTQTEGYEQGEIVTRAQTMNAGLPKRGSKGAFSRVSFDLTYHPRRWKWHPEHGFYPVLGRLWHQRGLEGVTDKGDTTPARVRLQRRGWIVIENGDSRLGEDADYLRRHKSQRGGWQHVTKWEHPRVSAGEVKWHKDQEGYHGFLKKLVEAGVVPGLDPDQKTTIVRKQADRVRKLEQDLFASPLNEMLRVRMEREKRTLAAMNGETEPVNGETEPEKTSTKRGK